MEEQVLASVFLCSAVPDPLIAALKPEWLDNLTFSAEEKLKWLGVQASLTNLFPWTSALTGGIDPVAFAASFLQQPDVFIRIRPGYHATLRSLFLSKEISFTEISNTCFAFSSGTKLDDYLSTNREAVIQDFNSQQVGELMEPVKQTDWVDVWDACAASGGKSIMAKDRLGKIRLTVSDIRESILHNLKKRLSEAGIGNFQTLVADLATADPLSPGDLFDLVIADVPCSGSGTWGRTPEQLYYFKENKIANYQQLQQRILKTVLPHVKPGGYLLYITCSVFRQENEEQVAFISADKTFTLIRQDCLKGYDKKADTMFAALLRRQS